MRVHASLCITTTNKVQHTTLSEQIDGSSLAFLSRPMTQSILLCLFHTSSEIYFKYFEEFRISSPLLMKFYKQVCGIFHSSVLIKRFPCSLYGKGSFQSRVKPEQR